MDLPVLTDTGVEVARVLIVDGGNEIYLFSETTGNAVYGVGKKISKPLLRSLKTISNPRCRAEAFASAYYSTTGPVDLSLIRRPSIHINGPTVQETADLRVGSLIGKPISMCRFTSLSV